MKKFTISRICIAAFLLSFIAFSNKADAACQLSGGTINGTCRIVIWEVNDYEVAVLSCGDPDEDTKGNCVQSMDEKLNER